MSSREKPRGVVRPDEWGFYDPEQAGLAALAERLNRQRRTPPHADHAKPSAGSPSASRRAPATVVKTRA